MGLGNSCKLSKYEVFSSMRWVHERVAGEMVETANAAANMVWAQKMVDELYEHLPAERLKTRSQQNQLKAGFREYSLVYE